MPQKVQSVKFKTDTSPSDVNGGDGWSRATARTWLLDHDLKASDAEETDSELAFKQFEASECDGAFQSLSENFPVGIRMVACNVPEARAYKEAATFDKALVECELRQSGSSKSERLVGYAAVWDQPSESFFGMREVIRRGAFTQTLQTGDSLALWNHDPGKVLGRVSAQTLDLAEDDTGLSVSINPPNTQAGHDAIEMVRRGDVKQMSFGFRAVRDRFFTDDDLGDMRELTQVDLLEVSPVPFPAYPDTEIGVREKLQAVELRRSLQGLTRREFDVLVSPESLRGQKAESMAQKRQRLEELSKIRI